MFKEFKAFIQRGSVIDLAVAVIIGAAFGAIVSAFVADVVSPIIGLLAGGADLSESFQITLKAAEMDGETVVREALVIKLGAFLQTVIDFLLVAFALFLIIKAYNSAKKKEEAAPAAPPAPSNEEKLLAEIRDLLKK